MTSLRRAALSVFAISAFYGAAMAQDAADPLRAIGGGIGVVSEPYMELDDETSFYPVPLLYLDGGRFSVAGTTASVRLYKNDRWEFAAMADYRFGGYEAEDSPVFVGMEDRNGTLELGGWVAFNIDDQIYLTGYAQQDVLDEHGGFELRAQAAWSINPHRATNITPSVGFAFRSEDLADYYYGVTEDEELLITDFNGTGEDYLRYAYASGETVTPYAGISIRQALSPKWAVFVSARHEFLPDEVEDSPIVDGDGRTVGGVTLGRLF